MIRKDYNNMIINRIEKNFDKIMPIGAVGSWIVAVMVYFSDIPNVFVVLNVTFGFGYALVALYKRKLSAKSKIVMTIIMITAIGVASFQSGGFSSAGMTLLFIVNTISVLYLDKRYSRQVASLTIVIYICLWIVAIFKPVDVDAIDAIAIWIVQLIVLTIYLLVLHTAVYSIKGYLLENIENLENSVMKSEQLAYYDQLTGLPNQYKFVEQLDQATKEADYGFLLFISIRNLNLINSIYSNRIGDLVLKKCVKIFSDLKGEEELLGRIGGNEIAVWMPFRDKGSFLKHIRRYKRSFYESFDMKNMTKRIEFCVSCSQHLKGQDSETTYHKAQLALTYGKTQTEDEIFFYDETLEQYIYEKERLKDVVELELEKESFYLNYQGKYSVLEGRIQSVEALARLNNQEMGQISPTIFIPIIEDLNHSVDFGEMIIKKALADYHKLCKKYNSEIAMAINISPTQLFNRNFSTYLKEQIRLNEIRPEKILIEITEEVLIENFDVVERAIRKIRNIGVKVSLDDFGSGYSSLNYLTKLEINEIKIDKSFIDQIFVNDNIVSMLEMIIGLSAKLNLNIVAEGVETFEQYQIMMKMGCNDIQGYFIAKPEPID